MNECKYIIFRKRENLWRFEEIASGCQELGLGMEPVLSMWNTGRISNSEITLYDIETSLKCVKTDIMRNMDNKQKCDFYYY